MFPKSSNSKLYCIRIRTPTIPWKHISRFFRARNSIKQTQDKTPISLIFLLILINTAMQGEIAAASQQQ
ncbi:unnamed protein product [Linum trigynum]|uniref:Uncharacterized protein n=1 Tax=Linum trigynum TaxID=586398 RepID=A0AAV2FGX2_9ROSI